MPRPTPSPPSTASARGVFTVDSSGAPGLTSAQVRSVNFPSPSRGVRLDGPQRALSTDALADAALIRSAPDAVLADVAAALRWTLPLPPKIGLHAVERAVAVAVPAGAARPRRRGVQGRRLRLPPAHVTESDGLRLTTPARTWLDCAALLEIEHVVAMGDAVLHRRLAHAEDLAAMVRWARRRRGVVNARTALPLLDERSESPGESLVRAHLLLAGLPRPVCNLDVIVDGEWLARADLAWPGHRVIVEYDGLVHLAERQRRHDAARRNLLQDAGWLVIVFTASDLAHPASMANLVRSTLTARQPSS